MPINTNLNTAPYFDDYDLENQYYRVLFKPGFAVQARELTQLQTMLQNQVEQFGDNIFKEGSIVKGCNFTQINKLEFVKIKDQNLGTLPAFAGRRVTETILGVEVEVDYVYTVTGGDTGLVAEIISAVDGFESRAPELNTLFVRYKNQTTSNSTGRFKEGESLTITLEKFKAGDLEPGEVNPFQTLSPGDPGFAPEVAAGSFQVMNDTNIVPNFVGSSFGIEASPGIIFQKGHFLFAAAQTLIVEKYSNQPNDKNVGYRIRESLTNSRQDSSLYDNANGSTNENAPGADRLKLIPELVSLGGAIAEADATFFSLIRYTDGNAVTLRDISQYNVIGEEMARRTYEESGNYILNNFKLKAERKENTANTSIEELRVTVGTGTAYVKGFRVDNKGESSFVIDDISETDLIENQPISFNYGGWFKVDSYNGPASSFTLGLQGSVGLLNVSSGTIGTAYITNALPGKVFLSHILMSSGNTADVVALDLGGGATADISAVDGFRNQENARSEFVFDTGLTSLKVTSDTILPVRQFQTGVDVSTNTFVLTASGNDSFGGANTPSDILVIDGTSTVLPVQSVSVSEPNMTVVVTGGTASAATVWFNKNINLSSSGPMAKIANTTYIRSTYSSVKKIYSLGIPDVFELLEVIDSAGIDVTKSFKLNSNARDTFYGYSYIEFTARAGAYQPANGTMSIKFKCFQLNSTSGAYFFTINSYPNTLNAHEIPAYTATNGKIYNLRECFDFRAIPDIRPGVAYSILSAGAAAIFTESVLNSEIGMSFADHGNPLVPAYRGTGITDIEHYLSRVDLLTVDSYGDTRLVKGEEERRAVPPRTEADQLVIGEITIPGLPALTMQEALALNKKQYAIKAKTKGIRNYTMKDLHSLEKKIDNMSYYISLNQLESDTSNLVITDETGATRFKNGFVVDPFNDLNIANVQDPDFNAAVHFKRKVLTPSVKQLPLDLIYDSGTNTQVHPRPSAQKAITFAKNTDVPVLTQPFATEFRNCVSNFYNFIGKGQITPPYDATYDTTTNPVSIEIDSGNPTQELFDQINEFSPLTDTDVTTSGVDRVTAGGVEQTRTKSLEIVGETVTTNNQYVGDFVTNLRMEPFMAGKQISVFMVGLRPSTRHYFFFDKINVDQFITPGSVNPSNGSTVGGSDDVVKTGSAGDAVFSDANGILRVVFDLPEETFFVGDRILEIVDVDQYSAIDSAGTSGGFVTYRAYNYSQDNISLTTTTTTRAPEFEVSESTTSRNLPSRPAPVPRPTPPLFRVGDPLAQTFFIKSGMGRGSNTIYSSKIDIYFKRKSSTNGVTVQLREVANGYPAAEVLPFSSIHLDHSEVVVSDDASAVTSVIFEAPVRLDTEKEYCVVVMPDANDPGYLIFTSKVGGPDLSPGVTNGQSVVQDWGDGVLFTSTNNRAWKSYQDEDIKFTLYRSNFAQTTGSVTLRNNNHEFLTVQSITGRFKKGETMYQLLTKNAATGAQVSVTAGSRSMAGTALDNTYAGGDYIMVDNGAVKEIFKVIAVVSANELTIDHAPAITFSNATASPVVKAELFYYDLRDATKLYLEGSTATDTRSLQPGGILYGLQSGFSCTITSIDNLDISYITPFISKTNDNATTTTLTGTFVDPENTSQDYQQKMRFNDHNYFNQRGCLLYSLSNDPNKAKAFNLTINMDSGGNITSTPVIDAEVSKIFANIYGVSNDEETTAKYISKTIELADDFDAEDFNCYLTAYKPTGTDIKVYIKGQHASDQSSFGYLDWAELELFEGIGMYGSSGNMSDFKEYRYRVADDDKIGNVSSGAYEYRAGQVGTFAGFRRFAIKIVLLSPKKGLVPIVKDYRGIALT